MRTKADFRSLAGPRQKNKREREIEKESLHLAVCVSECVQVWVWSNEHKRHANRPATVWATVLNVVLNTIFFLLRNRATCGLVVYPAHKAPTLLYSRTCGDILVIVPALSIAMSGSGEVRGRTRLARISRAVATSSAFIGEADAKWERKRKEREARGSVKLNFVRDAQIE